MPSRIAQRSRKSAKKTSKRVVLYVPDTFDPDVHLPEELRHLGDYARFLLHRINVGRVQLRRGNCLVYLKRDYLVEFIPKERFTAIRDALVESDVIHVRKFCVKGEMSYGYRLLYPHNQGFSLYQPTTKRLIDKIVRWRKRESDTLRHPVHRECSRSHPESGCILNRLPRNPRYFSVNSWMIVNISYDRYLSSRTVVDFGSCKVFSMVFV